MKIRWYVGYVIVLRIDSQELSFDGICAFDPLQSQNFTLVDFILCLIQVFRMLVVLSYVKAWPFMYDQ